MTTGRSVKAGDIGPVDRRRTVPPSTPRRTGLALPRPAADRGRRAPGLAWGGWLPDLLRQRVRRALGPGARDRPGTGRPAAVREVRVRGSRPAQCSASPTPSGALCPARTGVHYLGYLAQERLHTRADGRWVGGRSSDAGALARRRHGRAVQRRDGKQWPAMDVGDDHGRPVIVYARGVDGRTVMTYRYARYDGKRWTARHRSPPPPTRHGTSSRGGHFGARRGRSGPRGPVHGGPVARRRRHGSRAGVDDARRRDDVDAGAPTESRRQELLPPCRLARGRAGVEAGGLHLRQAGSLDRFRHRSLRQVHHGEGPTPAGASAGGRRPCRRAAASSAKSMPNMNSAFSSQRGPPRT